MAESVRRSFPEETVLKKLSFEKSLFLTDFLPELDMLKQGNYCAWRQSVRDSAGISQRQMKLKRMNLSSDISSLVKSLDSDQSFTSSNIIQRLSQVLRDKSKLQMDEWQKRRDYITQVSDIYKVVCL